ncbi:unnamed protein product, partial [Mesorhabditis belari]|uniref:Uncharacterized protein n=1 Tax=Mesorhabditis belari TaxID=2138241 RepID=A0AAF3FMH0_9BILA
MRHSHPSAACEKAIHKPMHTDGCYTTNSKLLRQALLARGEYWFGHPDMYVNPGGGRLVWLGASEKDNRFTLAWNTRCNAQERKLAFVLLVQYNLVLTIRTKLQIL